MMDGTISSCRSRQIAGRRPRYLFMFIPYGRTAMEVRHGAQQTRRRARKRPQAETLRQTPCTPTSSSLIPCQHPPMHPFKTFKRIKPDLRDKSSESACLFPIKRRPTSRRVSFPCRTDRGREFVTAWEILQERRRTSATIVPNHTEQLPATSRGALFFNGSVRTGVCQP